MKIPPLDMVDDAVAVTEWGLEAEEMNYYLNTKTNLKKIRFGTQKCFCMHVGCKKTFCPDVFVDEWKLKDVNEAKCNIREL